MFRVWDSSNYKVVCRGDVQQKRAICMGISDACIISGWNDGAIRYFIRIRIQRILNFSDHLTPLPGRNFGPLTMLTKSP